MDFPWSTVAIDPAKLVVRRVWNPNGKEESLSPEGIEENLGLLSFSPSSHGIYLAAVQTEASNLLWPRRILIPTWYRMDYRISICCEVRKGLLIKLGVNVTRNSPKLFFRWVKEVAGTHLASWDLS